MDFQKSEIRKKNNQSVANSAANKNIGKKTKYPIIDNRPEAVVQRKMQNLFTNSRQSIQHQAIQDKNNKSPQTSHAAKIQTMADNYTANKLTIQKKENKTGLPDNLKAGVENLSGLSLDDVKVHRNSEKPAQLQAHAYAQGTDIHLGPGQEKHLPHETWHVVQQKQGRVKPTVQMKDNIHINDDAELEKEADEMGSQALQKVSDHDNTGGITSANKSNAPIQRKFNVTTRDGRHIKSNETGWEFTRALAIERALRGNAETLKKFESENSEEDVTTLLNHRGLFDEIKMLNKSPIDFGEIDVNNVQQLAPIYFRLKKILLSPKGQSVILGEEEELYKQKDEQRTRDKNYRNAVKGLAHPKLGEKIYKTAILGSGASVAYYIANNEGQIDPKQTVVIGQEQPWREERGSQGVINHPMNMIAPIYQDGSELNDESGGLASRQGFSDQVEDIIKKLPWIDAKIVSVEKQGYDYTKYYKITTADGTAHYAQHVVLGLGIGKHNLPPDIRGNQEKQDEIAKPENAFKENIPRVMDIDQFQRAISNGEIEADKINSMIISGPNAAIDVATTAIRHGITNVSWLVGYSGPLFLPGTDNVYAAQSYSDAKQKGDDKQILEEGNITFYKYYYDNVAVSPEGVTVTYAARGAQRGDPTVPKGIIRADLMVYGLGPDVNDLRGMLSQSTPSGGNKRALRLEPIYDVNERFSVSTSEDLPERLLSYYKRELSKKGVKKDDLEESAKRELNKAMIELAKLKDVDNRIPEPRAFDFKPADKLPTVVGLRAEKDNDDDQSSLTIIGGAAYRLADRVDYQYLSGAFSDFLITEFFPTEAKITNANLYSHAGYLKQLVERSRDLIRDFERERDPKDYSIAYFKESINAEKEYFSKLSNIPYEVSEDDRKHYQLLLTRTRNLLDMTEEFIFNATANKAERQASTHMMKIPKTLPQNVGLSDQLTAIRSSEEARQEIVPGNVEKGINFITSDQTMIAVHIAVAYPSIPAPLTHIIVQKILLYRRHLPTDKAPLPFAIKGDDPNSAFSLEKQKGFQSFWQKYLSSANTSLKL